MPDKLQNQTHTRHLSADDRAELDKIVADEEQELGGAAADDDLNLGGEDDPDADKKGADGKAKPAATAAGADGAEKPGDAAAGAAVAAEGAGAGEAGDAEGGEGGDAVVDDKDPKARQVSGLIGELKSTRTELRDLKQRVNAVGEDLPDRDFKAENATLDSEEAALDERYDKGGDLSDVDYRKAQREIETKRRALDREQNRYELYNQLQADKRKQAEEDHKREIEAQKAAWETDLGAWLGTLGDWIKNPVRRATVDQTMLAMQNDPEMQKLPNAEYLARLDEALAEAFENFPRKAAKPAAGGAGDANDQGGTKPGGRRAESAARAAEVQGSPPVMHGGVGNRGTKSADIDLTKIHLGGFKKIPKDKQNELLGLPPDA